MGRWVPISRYDVLGCWLRRDATEPGWQTDGQGMSGQTRLYKCDTLNVIFCKSLSAYVEPDQSTFSVNMYRDTFHLNLRNALGFRLAKRRSVTTIVRIGQLMKK